MNIRDVIARISLQGSMDASRRTSRRGVLTVAKALAGKPKDVIRRVSEIADLESFVDATAAEWLDPEDIAEGQGGGFDACDLRIWLQIAERAGVSFVPARQILSLQEDDLGLLMGDINLPDFISSAVSRRAKSVFEGIGVGGEGVTDDVGAPPGADTGAAGSTRREKVLQLRGDLFDAMDDIPDNYMVRSHLSGSSNLKALVGSGVMEDANSTGKLSQDVEAGPGWMRIGNRRCIDALDERITSLFIGGHKDTLHFVARPWMPSGRRNEGLDPHRLGSPLEGVGSWPCEWRVFVANGKVTGVSTYYGWAGDVSPTAAKMALQAADLAQQMVDAASGMGLLTREMDHEMLHRSMKDRTGKSLMQAEEVFAAFPRDSINCTLDFMEVEGQGLMFLEGGPPHSHIGGGFPCAFAGHGMAKETGYFCQTVGVALTQIEGVHMAEPSSWFDKDSSGAVFSWDEARSIADLADTQPDDSLSMS